MMKMGSAATALRLAVEAIYFDDSSDFRRHFHQIVRVLDPETADLLESNKELAYQRAVNLEKAQED